MTDVVRLDQAPLVELLSVVSLLLVALLGAVIAVQAYRGYRRNDSRPMLYLAVGLCLLTLVPFLANVFLATAGVDRVEIALAENIARLLGLLAITYSLYGID